MDELKPCPFCGSSDLIGPIFEKWNGDYIEPSWYIECNNCPSSMKVWDEDKNNILNRWNARA